MTFGSLFPSDQLPLHHFLRGSFRRSYKTRRASRTDRQGRWSSAWSAPFVKGKLPGQGYVENDEFRVRILTDSFSTQVKTRASVSPIKWIEYRRRTGCFLRCFERLELFSSSRREFSRSPICMSRYDDNFLFFSVQYAAFDDEQRELSSSRFFSVRLISCRRVLNLSFSGRLHLADLRPHRQRCEYVFFYIFKAKLTALPSATTQQYNRNLASGGSSGGEAVLQALKGSPLGIGTDLGGSIRIPTGFNYQYGLKPSFGRYVSFSSSRRSPLER